MTKEDLILDLKQSNVLISHNIEKALKDVDRMDFVQPLDKQYAYHDKPFSIGYNQTISQPYTVVFMLELLQVKEGDNIMDVGSGSGWQTALLSDMVGESGNVYAIEIIPGLYKYGKDNIEKYPHLSDRVEFYNKNAVKGLPEQAKHIGGFDGIIASAELREVPLNWHEQLKIGGRMIYPKGGSVYREIKLSQEQYEVTVFRGFSFVPFVYQ